MEFSTRLGESIGMNGERARRQYIALILPFLWPVNGRQLQGGRHTKLGDASIFSCDERALASHHILESTRT